MQRLPQAPRRQRARPMPKGSPKAPAPEVATTARARPSGPLPKRWQRQSSRAPHPMARSPGPPPSVLTAEGHTAMLPSPGPVHRYESDRAWPANRPALRAFGPGARGTQAAGHAKASTVPGRGQPHARASTAGATRRPPVLQHRSRPHPSQPRHPRQRSWPVARVGMPLLPEVHHDRPRRMPDRTWPGSAAYRPGPASARSGRVRTPRRIHARDVRLRASATRGLRCSR